jgi:hypothetical protein
MEYPLFTEAPERGLLLVRFGQWCLAVEVTPGCGPIAMWLHDDDPELPWPVEVAFA